MKRLRYSPILILKYKRKGYSDPLNICNYVVQGASATILASGFYNNFRAAKEEGFVIEPIICVHDSCTNYFPVDKLFDLKSFYDKNFTDF